MKFVDREEMSSHFRGKNVAIVCSGPGILTNVRGFIDSFDVVVRVNNFVCTGPVTGTRTDIYYSFFGSSINKTVQELQRGGVKLCVCKCPDSQFTDSEWHRVNNKMRGVDFRYIYEQRKDWWFGPVYVPSTEEFLAHFNLLGEHVPTTGFAALLTILDCEPTSLYVTGMDFFQSRIHNVHQRWSPGNPNDPIGHVPDGERAWLAENIEALKAKGLCVTTDDVMQAAINNLVRPGRVNSSRPYRRRRVAA